MGKRSAARAAALAYAQQPAELGLLDGDLGVSSDVEGADDAAVRLASAAAAAGPRANGGAAAGSGEDASGGEAGEDEDSEGEASGDDSDAGVSSADEAAGRSEDAELDRALVDLVAAQAAQRGSADDGEAGGGEPGPGLPQPGAAEDSDSSEDEHPSRNTGKACDGHGGLVVAGPGRSAVDVLMTWLVAARSTTGRCRLCAPQAHHVAWRSEAAKEMQQIAALLSCRGAVLAVGEVPLEWYKAEEHVGYDVDGRPLARRPRPDRCSLTQLLCSPNGACYAHPAWRAYGMRAPLLLICEEENMRQRGPSGTECKVKLVVEIRDCLVRAQWKQAGANARWLAHPTG